MAQHLEGVSNRNLVGLSVRQTVGCVPSGHTGVDSCQTVACTKWDFLPESSFSERLLCGHTALLNNEMGIFKHKTQLNTSRITFTQIYLSQTFLCFNFWPTTAINSQSQSGVSIFLACCCNSSGNTAWNQAFKIGFQAAQLPADWVQSYQYPISFNQRPSSASVFCQHWVTVSSDFHVPPLPRFCFIFVPSSSDLLQYVSDCF